MKPSLIAITLLVLTTPAFADKQPSTAQQKTIDDYATAYGRCRDASPDDGDRISKEVVKWCASSKRLEKKLEAQGFCTYGRGAVGQTGRPWTLKEWEQDGTPGPVQPKGSRHCYILKD